MPTVQELVDFMSHNNHSGRNNTIIARDLALHFRISDGGVEVAMRDVIRDAIRNGHLIGSNSHGFYLINNLNEINRNLNSLESRAEKNLLRRRNLLNNWNSRNPTNRSNLTDLEIREV